MGKLHFPSWFQKIFHMKHKRSANTTPSNDDDPNILLLMNNLHHIQEKLDHALQLNLMYEKKVQQLTGHNDRLNQRLRDLKERHNIEKQDMERRMEDKEQEAKLLRNDLQKSHQENKYFKDGLVSLSKHVGNLSFKLNEEVNRRTLTMDKRGSK